MIEKLTNREFMEFALWCGFWAWLGIIGLILFVRYDLRRDNAIIAKAIRKIAGDLPQ